MLNRLKGNSSREDVAICLEYIAEGKDYVWGDFTDIVQRDSELERIRLYVLSLESLHPPHDGDIYLAVEGIKIIRDLVLQLRTGGAIELA